MPTANDPNSLSIPAGLVDLVLLGPADDRRQLQDSPILGDVWMAYAAKPGSTQDLLITPHKSTTAGNVAREIAARLGDVATDRKSASQIAYLQGLVAARLSLAEMLRVVVPLTHWWDAHHIPEALATKYNPTGLAVTLRELFGSIREGETDSRGSARVYEDFTSLDRYLGLAGLLLWARRKTGKQITPRNPKEPPKAPEILGAAMTDAKGVVKALLEVYEQIQSDQPVAETSAIFQVSLNRRVAPALDRSVPAVKGDAARSLFKVDTTKIAWAVLDSGIDHKHAAFLGDKDQSRVKRTFDFTKMRQIWNVDSHKMAKGELSEVLDNTGVPRREALKLLEELRHSARSGGQVNWDVAEKLLTLADPPRPSSAHGTHVAGIIGARKPAGDAVSYSDGMCPEIQLYDFRVLAKTIEDTEFALIAALQYIRYVNERHSYITIHGVNLSLSIPHNVRNYACGRTPVCNECQRLIESGVVVVAAAGNRGYQRFETKDGLFENYAAFSITDPGNAEDVITVGATHGNWPHTYGVSFFSSRGPTGDGRPKPDLVAPGERIEAPIPGSNNESGAESGTSMAAPHVSGAAAMLMARYPELIGNPRRIKGILCQSATDLSRERSFQGHGMLDVLRAFQSI